MGVAKGFYLPRDDGALSSLVEVTAVYDGVEVRFNLAGGGWSQLAAAAEFLGRFEPVSQERLEALRSAWRFEAFSGEWMADDACVGGWTNGERWNGWRKPYFDKDSAAALLGSSASPYHGCGRAVYAEARDAFLLVHAEGGLPEIDDAEVLRRVAADEQYFSVRTGGGRWVDVEIDVFAGETVAVGGGELKVYGIGAANWCWESPSPVASALFRLDDETRDWAEAMCGERPSLDLARAEATVAVASGEGCREALTALLDEARDWAAAMCGERPSLDAAVAVAASALDAGGAAPSP